RALRHTPHRHTVRLRNPHDAARRHHAHRRTSRRHHLDRPGTNHRLPRLALHHHDRCWRPRLHFHHHIDLRPHHSRRLGPRTHADRLLHRCLAQRLRAPTNDLHRGQHHHHLDTATRRPPKLRPSSKPRCHLDRTSRLLHFACIHNHRHTGH